MLLRFYCREQYCRGQKIRARLSRLPANRAAILGGVSAVVVPFFLYRRDNCTLRARGDLDGFMEMGLNDETLR